MTMLPEFLININKLGGGDTGQRTLLAVSGGVDSMVMMALYKEAGIDCGVAHCNFQLRGAASDLDATLVRELSARYDFVFHEISFDTKKVASEAGISTQMAARKLRYDWFSELAAHYGYHHIATAHHAGDQVETVVLNLVRGTGIRGLRGIPESNGLIVRPMLFATRSQIMDYAALNGLSWREDESNQDDYYRRNRIRHHVMPVLKSINPSLEATVREMTERLKEAEKLLDHVISAWREQVCTQEGVVVRISIEGIRSAISPAFQLYSVISEFGFSYVVTWEILKSLDGISGKEFHSPTHFLLKDRDFLIITAKEQPEVNQNGILSLEVYSRSEDTRIGSEKSAAFFDADLLKVPLRVRRWQTGDSLKPFGMDGRSKKVSDLLTDLKLDRIAKGNVRVVVDQDDEIVWVAGIRSSHKARVTAETRNIARVSISEG